MTWSAPLTAVANAALTSSQWNISVRDNLNETAPAKASAAGQIFVATGVNAIAARTISTARVDTSESTASTTYTNLATTGPTATVTTGTAALVFMTAQIGGNTTNESAFMGYAVSGATTVAADDTKAARLICTVAGAFMRCSTLEYAASLTPGSNVFTLQYRTDTGTASFVRRVITVIPL